MIITLLINVIVGAIGVILSIFPDVTTLPKIFGYDIDTALLDGVGKVNTVSSSVWALQYLFYGFLAILAYYGLKMLWKMLMGSRHGTHN